MHQLFLGDWRKPVTQEAIQLHTKRELWTTFMRHSLIINRLKML